MNYDEATEYLSAVQARAKVLNRKTRADLTAMAAATGMVEWFGQPSKDELVTWHLDREFPQRNEAWQVRIAQANETWRAIVPGAAR